MNITKEFISYKDLHEQLHSLFVDKYVDLVYNGCIEDYRDFYCELLHNTVFGILKDFDVYVHGDTHIIGNFMDIRFNWNHDHKNASDDFDIVVETIDNLYQLAEENNDISIIENNDVIRNFQIYAIDWFFKAFGTYNLVYNFQNQLIDCLGKEDINN